MGDTADSNISQSHITPLERGKSCVKRLDFGV